MGTHLPSPKGHSPQFSAHICCGQMTGWIKMPLGMEVGLDPGNFLLHRLMGTQLPLPKRGGAPPNFRPFLLWPNGWMHQGATWYGGTPRRRRLCVRWAPITSLPKKGAEPPNFRPICLLWTNGCMDQDAIWYKGELRPRQHCVR